MNMCRMVGINVSTHRYMVMGCERDICIDWRAHNTLKLTKIQQLNPLSEQKPKNVDFDPPKGFLPLIFFQWNLIYIILGYRWVDLDTYIGQMTHLKNGHFSTRPPNTPQFQVKDFDLTFGCTEGQRSNTVQSDGSVVLGCRSDWMDKHCCQAMPHQSRLYKDKLRQVHQGLPQGSHQDPQCWRPADLLASHLQEARPHVNAWVHATSKTAPQLPQQWLLCPWK